MDLAGRAIDRRAGVARPAPGRGAAARARRAAPRHVRRRAHARPARMHRSRSAGRRPGGPTRCGGTSTGCATARRGGWSDSSAAASGPSPALRPGRAGRTSPVLRRAGAGRPGHLVAAPPGTGSPRSAACWRWSPATLARIGGEVYELQRPEIGELREPSATASSAASRCRTSGTRSAASTSTPCPGWSAPTPVCCSKGWSGSTSATAAAGRPSGSRCPRCACSRRPHCRAAVALLEGLEVDAQAMRANLDGYTGSEHALAAAERRGLGHARRARGPAGGPGRRAARPVCPMDAGAAGRRPVTPG